MKAVRFGRALIPVCALWAACFAAAQSYPSRPMSFVIPFPAGGSTDAAGRLMAAHLAESLGQSVTAQNRPGNAGVDSIAKAMPDGHTVGLAGLGPLILAQISGPKPSFAVSDLELIAHAGNIELMIVASPGPPFANLEALVAAAKERPLTYAHGGAGGPSHLAFEYFARTAGIKLNAAAYKGEAQLIESLVIRDFAVGSVALAPLLPRVRAGELRVLAVTSAARSPLLPNSRTVAEVGYPGFEASTFNLLVTRAGTSREIVARLNAAFNAGLTNPVLRDKLVPLGVVPVTMTPVEAGAFLERETRKWAGVLK